MLFGACLSANAQWNTITSSATDKLHAIHFFDANNGICSGYSPQQGTVNGGTSWTNMSIGGANDYSFASSTVGYAAGSAGNSMRKTTNAGVSWTSITPPTSNSLWAVYAVDANVAYFVGTGGVLWKTANGGTSVSVLNSGTTDQLTDIVFTSATNGLLVTQTGYIKRTTNGGSSWTTVYDAASGVSLSEMHFTDAMTGYVCGSKGTIVKTTDGGANWTELNSGSTTAVFQGIHFFDANHGITVGLAGTMSFTTDGGANWCFQTISANHLRDVRMLTATGAIVTGESGTILKNTNIACTLGLNDELTEETVISPNPFNDQLTITAKDLEQVTLYNASGQAVSVPVQSVQDGSLTFNCSEVPAGIYMAVIETAHGVTQRKVVKL